METVSIIHARFHKRLICYCILFPALFVCVEGADVTTVASADPPAKSTTHPATVRGANASAQPGPVAAAKSGT